MISHHLRTRQEETRFPHFQACECHQDGLPPWGKHSRHVACRHFIGDQPTAPRAMFGFICIPARAPDSHCVSFPVVHASLSTCANTWRAEVLQVGRSGPSPPRARCFGHTHTHTHRHRRSLSGKPVNHASESRPQRCPVGHTDAVIPEWVIRGDISGGIESDLWASCFSAVPRQDAVGWK